MIFQMHNVRINFITKSTCIYFNISMPIKMLQTSLNGLSFLTFIKLNEGIFKCKFEIYKRKKNNIN